MPAKRKPKRNHCRTERLLCIQLATIKGLNLTLQCLVLVAGGVSFFAEKPYHQARILDKGPAPFGNLPPGRRRTEFRRKIKSLSAQELIEQRRRGNRLIYAVTEKGWLELLPAALKSAPRIKEGFIHVCFDIPERQRKARDWLRRMLKRAGFSRCQKSLWSTDRDVVALLEAFVLDHDLKPWVKVVVGTSNFCEHSN